MEFSFVCLIFGGDKVLPARKICIQPIYQINSLKIYFLPSKMVNHKMACHSKQEPDKTGEYI